MSVAFVTTDLGIQRNTVLLSIRNRKMIMIVANSIMSLFNPNFTIWEVPSSNFSPTMVEWNQIKLKPGGKWIKKKELKPPKMVELWIRINQTKEVWVKRWKLEIGVNGPDRHTPVSNVLMIFSFVFCLEKLKNRKLF